MKPADLVQTNAVRPWIIYPNRPSVAQKLIDARANGKSGVVEGPGNSADWWIVRQTDGTLAAYHSSELVVKPTEINRVDPKITPEPPEHGEPLYRPFSKAR